MVFAIHHFETGKSIEAGYHIIQYMKNKRIDLIKGNNKIDDPLPIKTMVTYLVVVYMDTLLFLLFLLYI